MVVSSCFANALSLSSLWTLPLASKGKTIGNDYPLVLVHGLTGWGRDEMGGIKYWGGLKDIEEDLNETGHRTYTATVGPVSSNYDRAVELYYYIKGGKVDYGAAHAKKYGHNRYGRTYPGIYSQWDRNHKIHLVGHSMGGQTARTLVELLKNGAEEERKHYREHPEDVFSPLFQGGKNWVHSVTTLGTPHNGSTFADEQRLAPLLQEMVLQGASVSGAKMEALTYDYKLDHWGLKRHPRESFLTYAERVRDSSIWESEDISLHDLTTWGAAKINQWVKTHRDVYYFSYTGKATYQDRLTGRSIPRLSMNPLMRSSSLYIGSYKRTSPEPNIDERWWPNDGVVSVISAQYPFGHPYKRYDGNVQKGVWNHFPVHSGWDHFDLIGIGSADNIGLKDLNRLYYELACNLHHLPK
ncbi:triacylglycerol lipase [Mesobacillus persicus]|uniref:triacylglycerol lipase n=1 Tax=Mesobacillus persicus TaxID=930146 RepID=A0A1H8DFX9_9BACI|nr:lipase [Mesobacillus persicus]SEN06199.1 triacylglycerol lipase [Mesobacillus persicus]